MQLTPFLRDPYVIRAQIAHHAQPPATPPNRVKIAQKSGFVRDPYAILPFGLCDRALKYIRLFVSYNVHHIQPALLLQKEVCVLDLIIRLKFHPSIQVC